MSFQLSVERLVQVPLTEGQLFALNNLFSDMDDFGIGGPESSIEASRLLHHLNRGEYQIACAELGKWCRIDGRVSDHFMKKRRMDQALFLKE